MKIVIFADVHGNLPALELLLLTEQKADSFVCLGDVVNYGPWSDECVELLATYRPDVMRCLQGNHERDYIAGRSSATGLAQEFFDFCYPKFTKFDAIKKYIPSMAIKGHIFQHSLNGCAIFPDSRPEFDINYIIGHSHHESLHEFNGNKLWVVGSCGQNRKYINRIDYAVCHYPKMKIEFKHLIYDENMIISEMKARDYPQKFIEYYSKKERA